MRCQNIVELNDVFFHLYEGSFIVEHLQHTIKKAVSYRGNGLHSGIPVTLTMLPAEPDTGIRFRRVDLPGHPAKVFTVEHLLSGLYALSINNCIIEMDSPEPPVGDGSARTFVDLIREAGIETQDKPVSVFNLPESVSVYEKNKFIAALPYDGLRVTFTSINPHPMLGTQMFDLVITPESYLKEIASARTIGFTWELEAMKKLGLGKGGTLENAVIYSEDTCLSQPRWPDELVRHKILDILGDISLIGPMHAHIIAVLGSHKLNAELSAKLIKIRNELHV